MLAADGACCTGRTDGIGVGLHGLDRQSFSLGKGAVLKIASRQCIQTIEGQQVAQGSELPVLRGRCSTRLSSQFARSFEQALGVGPLDTRPSANTDRLDVFHSQNRTGPTASGMPPVVRDGGVANGVFTCRTDDREGIIFPEPGSQIGFGSGAGESPCVRSGLNDRGPFVDQKDGRLVRLARDDQRVESRLLARNGETTAGQRVI